jgi:hypothetical protein
MEFINGLIEIIFKAQKISKPTKYIIGLLAFICLVQIVNIFGLFNIKALVAASIVFGFLFFFLMFSSLAERDKKVHSSVKYMAMIFGFTLTMTFFLFTTSLFFDYPKNIRDLLSNFNSKEENPNFTDDGNLVWSQLMNFTRLDEESCGFPIMYPDSIFGQKIGSDSVTVSWGAVNQNTFEFPKAPMMTKGFWGFTVPFLLEGKQKGLPITITNRLKVKIYSQSKTYTHGNAERTCAGDGHLSTSNETVILHTKKPYYEQTIFFPRADFFTLIKNETIGFEINFKIKDPGTYKVIVDVPFFYNEKKGVATLNLSYFIAPKSFDLWENSFDYSDSTKTMLYKNISYTWDGSNYDGVYTKLYNF